MRENPYDKVLDKTMKRVENATNRIAKNFRGVKPFDKEPIDNKELLKYYEGLTPKDMSYLVQTHGAEAMNDFIYEMEMTRIGVKP